MKLGARGVPAFLIDGELIVGFDKNKIKSMIDYKIINCPECGQKLRVPKDKGKIKVECKNCDARFIVKT
jgi:DNA-directed RNA polymerase subunit RPC12/RpoP